MNDEQAYIDACNKLREKHIPAPGNISPFLRKFLASVYQEQKTCEAYAIQQAAYLSKLFNTKVTVKPTKTILDHIHL